MKVIRKFSPHFSDSIRLLARCKKLEKDIAEQHEKFSEEIKSLNYLRVLNSSLANTLNRERFEHAKANGYYDQKPRAKWNEGAK